MSVRTDAETEALYLASQLIQNDAVPDYVKAPVAGWAFYKLGPEVWARMAGPNHDRQRDPAAPPGARLP